MNRLISLVAFACLTPSIALATPQASHEDTYSPFGPEWKSKLNLYNGSYNVIEYVRKDDSMKDPNQVITIQNFTGNAKRSLEDEMSKVRAAMEKKCQDRISRWNVVAEDASSLLFEWHANQCREWPEQEHITRIILGPHSWYMVAYAANTHEFTPEAHSQWIKTLSDVTFESITMAFDPNFISVDVDEVVPFDMDRVGVALKPAMESENCTVTEATASRVECKRRRVHATWTNGGSGGESVTATLEAKGNQTHVVITTGLGFGGQLAAKRNWSMPIFEEMLKILQKSTHQ
ncbi:MAG: hypothetical protein WAM58_13860 [Candidatus Acidiferrum sp.]